MLLVEAVGNCCWWWWR